MSDKFSNDLRLARHQPKQEETFKLKNFKLEATEDVKIDPVTMPHYLDPAKMSEAPKEVLFRFFTDADLYITQQFPRFELYTSYFREKPKDD